jgi:hypothetical protein
VGHLGEVKNSSADDSWLPPSSIAAWGPHGGSPGLFCPAALGSPHCERKAADQVFDELQGFPDSFSNTMTSKEGIWARSRKAGAMGLWGTCTFTGVLPAVEKLCYMAL